MAIPYPPELKEKAIQLVLNGRSAVSVATEYNIHPQTIYAWVSAVRKKAKMIGQTINPSDSFMKKSAPPLPQGKSFDQALESMFFARIHGIDSNEMGVYCREKGLLPQEVQAFTEWYEQTQLVDAMSLKQAQQEVKNTKQQLDAQTKQVKKLQRELKIKSDALAETAALLVLSKKVKAIWGQKES